ncbi:Spo0B domain-containing protein [Paenibacillus oenotherae]|uniref:histidine kinase n=1 Tax=Paenibacillus oenotherae TaxID=1435645 RepID=A0ABS7DBP5_9BACL|nr:ATP-binding protein [Paenibacillus oenotherae]MBW7477036.1 Spo0B domain-containing protein [Paenibacillus oenotherae]
MTLPPDYFSKTLQLVFIINIPQTLVAMWFSFVCMGLFPKNYGRRIVIYSILQSIYVAIPFLMITTWIHAINGLLSMFVFISFIFPEFKIKLRILVIFFMMIVCASFEVFYSYISQYFGGYDAVRYNYPAFTISIVWPGICLIALITGFLQWKKIHAAKQIRQFIIHIKSVPYFFLFILLIVQVILFMLFFAHLFFQQFPIPMLQVAFIIIFGLFIYMAIKIMQIIVKLRIEGSYKSQEMYISDLNKMFASIRGQRHDFANHVQVMYSMLSLNKYDQLRTYMQEVVEEIQSMNVAIVELPSPALAALIQAKTAIALEKKIRFDYLIHSASLTFSSVTSIDLVRIIGNLVDNAFDEVVKLPPAEREVQLEMYIHKEELYITVTNRGIILTSEAIEQIFRPGFTTKADGHTGLGLANVRERAASYNGQVTVDSDLERGVTFTIKIPNTKQTKAKQA